MAAGGIAVLAYMQNDHQGVLGQLPIIPSTVLGAVGIIGSATGCLGFVSALRENIRLLQLFCLAASVLFVGEIIGGVLMFLLMNSAKSVISSHLLRAIVVYQDDETLQDFVDFIQRKMECCGANDYWDWDLNSLFNCTPSDETVYSQLRCTVPVSCCAIRGDFNCGLRVQPKGVSIQIDAQTSILELLAESTVYTQGCTEPVLQAFKLSLFQVSILAFAIGLLEVISVILANRLALIVLQSDSISVTSSVCQEDGVLHPDDDNIKSETTADH